MEDFIKSKTIFGEHIQIGDTTLIPVVDVSFGLGSGSGDGSDNKGNGGIGGGAGVGARPPAAIIVMKDNNVEVLPIKKSSGLENSLKWSLICSKDKIRDAGKDMATIKNNTINKTPLFIMTGCSLLDWLI